MRVCVCMSEQLRHQCFMWPMRREEVEGREECYGGPQGAELGTLTSVRRWSVQQTSWLPGDSSLFVWGFFSQKYLLMC